MERGEHEAVRGGKSNRSLRRTKSSKEAKMKRRWRMAFQNIRASASLFFCHYAEGGGSVTSCPVTCHHSAKIRGEMFSQHLRWGLLSTSQSKIYASTETNLRKLTQKTLFFPNASVSVPHSFGNQCCEGRWVSSQKLLSQTCAFPQSCWGVFQVHKT